MNNNLNTSIKVATKWSAITEVIAKLIAPISSMVLARLLTPDNFGIIATITMVISFAEIFADAGFQKYIIYYDFKNEKELSQSVDVAFWTNLSISILLWIIIFLFKGVIASSVGNPGLGNTLAIACTIIPVTALTSIHISIFRRQFNFKALFYVRLISIATPLVITIPLAFIFKNYWSIIIGMLLSQLISAIMLTIMSDYKVRLYYSFSKLRHMLSYCLWSLVDSILIWLTSYIDVFFIGIYLSSYYLGLYKTSITITEQILSLITSIVLPVMLPALSRLQNDYTELKKMVLKFQKYTSILIIPIGVGIYIYRDLVTSILLGDQWVEASYFIGIWGLMSVITIIFSRFCSVIFPAIGKPKYSVLVQCLHLIVLVPAIIISVKFGYDTLVIVRTLVRIELIIVNFIFAYILVRLSPLKMFINILPEIISAIIMAAFSYLLLKLGSSNIWQMFSILLSALFYFIVLILLFPKQRQIFNQIFENILIRIKK